MIMMTGVDWRK